jgi:hypothetical protein
MSCEVSETVAMALDQVVVAAETKAAQDRDLARQLLAAEPDVLARLWEKVNALAEHRRIDRGLRDDLLRVAGRLDPALATQLERELDEFLPAVVLAAHADELIEDRPLGAFPRRDSVEAPTVEEWLIEDPRRLRGVVREVARFCTDDRRVVESVLALAESLGIDPRVAGDIIGPALRDVRHPWAAAQ